MTRREKIAERRMERDFVRSKRIQREIAFRSNVPSKRQSKAIGSGTGQKYLKVFPVIKTLSHH